MTYVCQFSDGPLDGVKFESPIPFDEIRFSRVIDDESEFTVFYECDWMQKGIEWRKSRNQVTESDKATLLNFVVGPGQ